MKASPDTFLLLMRYLDGQLSADERKAVNELLRTDAAARRWLLEIAGQAFLMGDLAQSRAVARTPALAQRSARTWWRPLAWAAAAVALLSAGLAWWAPFGQRTLVTLTEVSGSVLWSSGKGDTRSDLAVGARLPAGSVETVGAVSAAQLRFEDGTRLTLGGNSEVALANAGQKRIHLKSGTLTAAVTKQPQGRPLLVRTPTAEVEVLGTLFAVSAQPEATRLDVASGTVKMRRLVDGHAVEVTAQQSAVASLDAQTPFVAGAPVMPPGQWSAPLAAPPLNGSKGVVRAGAPAGWHGVPLMMSRRQGAPVIHYGITVRDNTQPAAGSFVTLAEDTVITLRWRTQQPSGLFIFIGTQKPGGAFGGNFELKPAKLAGTPDADGWRTASFPLREFRPLQSHRAAFAGHRVSAVIVTTYERDAGLEVAGLEIRKP